MNRHVDETTAVLATHPSTEPAPVESDLVAGRRGQGPRGSWIHAVGSSAGSVILFGIIFVYFGITQGENFVNADARLLDVSQNVPILILALGVVLCLSVGQFDLSIASMATFAAFLTIGLHINSGWPLLLSALFAITVGCLVGLGNGLLVMRLKVNAFIATLGTGGILTGASAVYSGSTLVRGPLPEWFSGPGSIGSFQEKVPPIVAVLTTAMVALVAVASAHHRALPSRVRGAVRVVILVALGAGIMLAAWLGEIMEKLSWTIFILAVVGTLVWSLMTYTSFGRSVLAVGGNARASSFVGIRSERVTILVFVLTGCLGALGGVVLSAMQGAALPGAADPMLLPAYAAAFLSTVVASRGRYHAWGAIVGGVMVVYVAQGLVLSGVYFTWTGVINGAVLIIAVAFSARMRHR